VLVRDIDFACLSRDSLLPFYGRAHIAYVPSNGVVLGLSKLGESCCTCLLSHTIVHVGHQHMMSASPVSAHLHACSCLCMMPGVLWS
jgi:hypothetical protein